MANNATSGACLLQRLIAWIDVGLSYHLLLEPYGEIGGLVVAAPYRSVGMGKALMTTAEQRIKSQGVT